MVHAMRAITAIAVAGLLLAAGCGDDDGGGGAAPAPPADDPVVRPKQRDAKATEPKRTGTEIVLRGSQFGTMLFDRRRQAIYVFERDSKGESTCYGDCAEAWPPVYTKGEPRAGKGVRRSLLGTVERRDGRRQVTYAGRPLYFYAHEGPGEVRCHNVNLNGGLWWVVGPDGRRRP
jgi:predicted lipoprotein with Yx(FWY)xxD motif